MTYVIIGIICFAVGSFIGYAIGVEDEDELWEEKRCKR